jgi:hypothetical protein
MPAISEAIAGPSLDKMRRAGDDLWSDAMSPGIDFCNRANGVTAPPYDQKSEGFQFPQLLTSLLTFHHS